MEPVLSKPSSPTVLHSRLIAFLDILGFSNRLETQTLEELHDAYGQLIDEARTTVLGASTAEGTNFAKAQFIYDSVVLVSHSLDGPAGPTSVYALVSAVSHLLQQAFARRMPLRGAIGLGDFLDDPARGIFLSPVLPKLVAAEKQQDWCGVLILDSALDAICEGLHGARPEDLRQTPANLLLEYPVPMKASLVGPVQRPLWCVNWVWLTDGPVLNDRLTWIDEPKRRFVRDFIDHVHALPNQAAEVRLPAPVGTVVAARFQFARAGLTIKFLDAEGRGANLPPGTPVDIRIVDGSPQLEPTA